jgi:decaprenylphospho-beta-D-ribofuranose 2-oxidase
MKLAGWGRYPALDCHLIEPRSADEAVDAIRRTPCLIARGAGRSYGDAALNAAATLSMAEVNRIRAFDREAGVIDAEAGLRLSDLIDHVLPSGWFPMVVPGTAAVTLGGMVASDVHGKNHHVEGSFGDHLVDLDLATADGTVVRCAPGDGTDRFDRTVGGMGLTGVILSARVRLRRVETAMMDVATHRRDDLDGLLSALDGTARSRYVVAWIDTLARGRRFGRGLVFAGDHACRDALPPSQRGRPFDRPGRRRLRVPFELPATLVRPALMSMFNAIYHRMPRAARRLVDVDRFFFPLDAIGGWNRLYGRSGFVQFQCVLPESDADRGLSRLLDVVSAARTGSVLAVLKTLGPGTRPLSFPRAGRTLALDMPAGADTAATYRRLCDIALEHGGRIYLSKDAMADAVDIGVGYPGAASFRAARRRDGSAERFRSALSDRVSL